MHLNWLLHRLDDIVILGKLWGAGGLGLRAWLLLEGKVCRGLLIGVEGTAVTVQERLCEVVSPTCNAGSAVSFTDPRVGDQEEVELDIADRELIAHIFPIEGVLVLVDSEV